MDCVNFGCYCDKSDGWQILGTKSQFGYTKENDRAQYAFRKRSSLNDIHNQTEWIDDSSAKNWAPITAQNKKGFCRYKRISNVL